MERIRFHRSLLPSRLDIDADSEASQSRTAQHHLPPEKMKHMFALQPIVDSDLDDASEFLCHCVRCKWTFQVSRARASIVAINNVGEPIAGAEARKRIATVAEGPCPAFADFPEYEKACAAIRRYRILDNLRPLLHLFGLSF